MLHPDQLTTRTVKRATMLSHAMTNILIQQELEIREVIHIIHDNIDQQRSDLNICLPELREVLIGLLQEHCSDTDYLANEMGMGHTGVLLWDQRVDQLVEEANEAILLTGIFMRNDDHWYGEEVPAMSEPFTRQPRTEVATESAKTTVLPMTEFPSVSVEDSMQPRTVVENAAEISPPETKVQVSTLDTIDAAVYLPPGDNLNDATTRQQASAYLEDLPCPTVQVKVE